MPGTEFLLKNVKGFQLNRTKSYSILEWNEMDKIYNFVQSNYGNIQNNHK